MQIGYNCPYIVTKVGDHNYRCCRPTDGNLLCQMHEELVVKALEVVNASLSEAINGKTA